MKGILLHVCCGPCATQSIVELLQDSLNVTLFFSNSNIHPQDEYLARLDSLKTYAGQLNIPLIIDNYNPEEWFTRIKGYELCLEGGERCKICIELRLEETARYAKSHGFEGFTTTLTISPHKNTPMINEIGARLSEKYGIQFLAKNFKKKDGFKKSLEISKQYKLYRQNYCGCKFSMGKPEDYCPSTNIASPKL